MLGADDVSNLVALEAEAVLAGDPQRALSTSNAILSVINGQAMDAAAEMDSAGGRKKRA